MNVALVGTGFMLDVCYYSCFFLVDNPSKCGAYERVGLITIAVVELIRDKEDGDRGWVYRDCQMGSSFLKIF